MDWVEGSSLADAIRRRRPLRSLIEVIRQVSEAVAYAHSRGVVHRDLKPPNIRVARDGRAYVVDFGLAHDRLASLELTRSGHVLGSPAYMSPEQARGDPSRVGPPADIYALGATLYECLTGSPPFASPFLADTLRAVAEEDPVPPRRRSWQVPRDAERICLNAMEKDPRKRYSRAGALAEDLGRFLAGEAVTARGRGLPYRLLRAAARNWKGLAAGCAVALMVSVVTALALRSRWGTTATNMLAQARELGRAGEFAGAAALYRRALEEHPVFLERVPRDEAWRGFVEAKTRVARARYEAGQPASAAGTLEAVVAIFHDRRGEPLPDTLPEVLWDLAAYRMATGELPDALETIEELRALLARTYRRTRRLDVPLRPDEGTRVLNDALRIFQERAEPWRDAAGLMAFRATAAMPRELWIEAWFAEAGPTGAELFARMMTVAPRAELRTGAYGELLRAAATPELARELARALAGEPPAEDGGSAWTRIVLADALSLVADLPFRLLREVRGTEAALEADASPGASPAAVHALFREVSGLERAAGRAWSISGGAFWGPIFAALLAAALLALVAGQLVFRVADASAPPAAVDFERLRDTRALLTVLSGTVTISLLAPLVPSAWRLARAPSSLRGARGGQSGWRRREPQTSPLAECTSGRAKSESEGTRHRPRGTEN